MIHMVQCLCGPARHAIYGMMYDDANGDGPEYMKAALEVLVEAMVEQGTIRRRCEICDKDIKQFWYEDHVTIEQDWDNAKAVAQRSEMHQTLARLMVQAARKAGKN